MEHTKAVQTTAGVSPCLQPSVTAANMHDYSTSLSIRCCSHASLTASIQHCTQPVSFPDHSLVTHLPSPRVSHGHYLAAQAPCSCAGAARAWGAQQAAALQSQSGEEAGVHLQPSQQTAQPACHQHHGRVQRGPAGMTPRLQVVPCSILTSGSVSLFAYSCFPVLVQLLA